MKSILRIMLFTVTIFCVSNMFYSEIICGKENIVLNKDIIASASAIQPEKNYSDSDNNENTIPDMSGIKKNPTTAYKNNIGNKTINITEDGMYYFDNTSDITNIVVADNVKANITINNLTLDLTYANFSHGESAIKIGEGADVTLIIEGENKFVSDGEFACIFVNMGATLTIDGNGRLEVYSEMGCAIGGAMDGSKYESRFYGNIIINGGTIFAKSICSSAIGGSPLWDGRIDTRSAIGKDTNCLTGNIIINGGNVTAIGGSYEEVMWWDGSAGIGGPYGKGSGNYIAIYGGTVNAYGGYHAPGIGYGVGGSNINRSIEGDIRIYGGTVNAYGGGGGAPGIGRSYDCHNCPTIEIYGGTVNAYGGENGSGIDITHDDDFCAGWIEICGGTVTAIGNGTGFGIAGRDAAPDLYGQIWINGGSVKGVGIRDISYSYIQNYNTNNYVKVNKIYAPNVSAKTVKINGEITNIPANHPDDDYIYVYASDDDQITIEDNTILSGDIDSDNLITSTDANYILFNSAGLKNLSDDEIAAGDIDHDGIITSTDANYILFASAGLRELN